MDTLEAIRTRRSVRKFSDKPVEEEKIQTLLESVRLAPSWANRQCWRFVIVRAPGVKSEISQLSYVESFFAPLGYKTNPAQKGIDEAPVVLVACANPSQSGTIWGQTYYLADIGIASQNLMLAAHSLGLGTVFVGVFDEEKLRDLLRIPREIRIVGIFPVGYPREDTLSGPGRKPRHELFFSEHWGIPYSL